MRTKNFVREIDGISIEFWIAKPFEKVREIILECDSGDGYTFYTEEPFFGPQGYRVIVSADGDIMAVVKSVEDIVRFVLEYVDAEELRARGVTWIDATIR
jgi:hypothetical protein